MVNFTWEKCDNTGTVSGTFTTLSWGNASLGSPLGVQVRFTADSDLSDVRLWVSDNVTDNAAPGAWCSATGNSFRATLNYLGSGTGSAYSGSQGELNTSATTSGVYLSSTDPGAGAPNIASGSTIPSGSATYLQLGVAPQTDLSLGTHGGIILIKSFSFS